MSHIKLQHGDILKGKESNELAAEVRKQTTLNSVLRSTSRWNGTAAMGMNYVELKDYLQDFEDDHHIIDFLLTYREEFLQNVNFLQICI